MMRKWTGKW